MVHGLEKFKEYFGDYTNQYVFIGGTACDILMKDIGVPFRATNDLDMVLITEELEVSFAEAFWRFIEDGGYSHRKKNSGENQFYRFTEPSDLSFPKTIELFSRCPNNFELKVNMGLTPIHVDESIDSLSAILFNDDYYDLLIKGNRTVDGYSIIEIETIILFKVKAWLDLNERKEAGQPVDSKNIKKHKNDVFRLLANVTPSHKMEITEEIQKDLIQFIKLIEEDRPDLRNLRIKGTSFDELIEILKNVFLIVPDIL